MITYSWEALDQLLADGLRDLAYEDWQEVENHTAEVPLDIDWDRMRSLEAGHVYRIIAARRDGVLVGYNAFFLNYHMRYRGTVYAISDVLYLKPEERRGMTGVLFLKESDRLLKEAGVQKVRYSIKTHVRLGVRAGTVGDLLKHLGYEHVEDVFSKLM